MKAFNDNMTAENVNLHPFQTIKAVDEPRERSTYRKTHQTMSFQKLEITAEDSQVSGGGFQEIQVVCSHERTN